MKELIINGMIVLGITFMISSYLMYLFEFEDKFRILNIVIIAGAVTTLIIICMTILMFLV